MNDITNNKPEEDINSISLLATKIVSTIAVFSLLAYAMIYYFNDEKIFNIIVLVTFLILATIVLTVIIRNEEKKYKKVEKND